MIIKTASQIFRIRRRCILHSVTAALLLMMSVSVVWAQFMVQPVNLAYLSQRADIIVQGRVKNVSIEPMPGYPNIPTVAVTVAVDQSLRGVANGTYTFREVLIGQKPKSRKKVYGVGQSLFLFLPSPSQYGLSSPIGMEQGRFRIVQDSTGKPTIINDRGNAGLFRDVDRAAARAGRQLTASQRQLTATEKGPVPLDEFVSLVKSLTTLPRIR